MKSLAFIAFTFTAYWAGKNSFILSQLSKNMASIEEFKAVTARIEAAADKIIANQGISKAQEDALLVTLTEQAEELEARASYAPIVQPNEDDLPPLSE